MEGPREDEKEMGVFAIAVNALFFAMVLVGSTLSGDAGMALIFFFPLVCLISGLGTLIGLIAMFRWGPRGQCSSTLVSRTLACAAPAILSYVFLVT